jgi:mannose-6-phosphate isomerase-like protein (cupin superfamily)
MQRTIGHVPDAPLAELHLSDAPTVTAPDGSDVHVLLARPGGSMAVFVLEPGRVSAAVAHRTVDEIWFVLDGRGEMWRRDGREERVVALSAGQCLTIPAGTAFQFRAASDERLRVVAVTMPPWPGPDEATPVAGREEWR